MATILHGFSALKDVFSSPVVEKITEVNDAVTQAMAEHNRQIEALYGLFCSRTTEKKVRFVGAAAAKLQSADEFARTRPIKGGSKYDVAFPLLSAIGSLGKTWDAAQKMTVQQANNELANLFMADMRWQRGQIVAALCANASWTHTNEEDGDLTIMGLANADTVEYQIMTGADTSATDTHYLAQSSAIDNSHDPFPTIRAELMEHPENSGDVIALIPSDLKASVMALSDFLPIADPRVRAGSGSAQLIGSLDFPIPGELFGYHQDKVWLAEWRALPSNYIVSVTTEGERALKMREETLPALRGFIKVADQSDHPFYKTTYKRIAGYGAWNRVGATVTRVGNASYAVPTGYECPMA
ncbi:MAG: hypothetical protein WC655_21340 [Candidatus Hydrogenedentales bacterium]|jgi:hypothetical protein